MAKLHLNLPDLQTQIIHNEGRKKKKKRAHYTRAILKKMLPMAKT